MKRVVTIFCTVVASAAIIVAMLVVSIETIAMDRGFYADEYTKLGTAQSIGISEDELTEATDVLLGYTAGQRDSLGFEATIGGQAREVFNQREKDHMVDVRALYITARDVRTYGLVAAAVLIIIAFIVSRKKAAGQLFRSFLGVSGAFLALVIAVVVWALVDFNSFWTAFHHVFFTNDLWILDPRTDILIQMVPSQFFFDLVTRIIVRFVAIFAALNIAAAFGRWLYKRKARQAQAVSEAS